MVFRKLKGAVKGAAGKIKSTATSVTGTGSLKDKLKKTAGAALVVAATGGTGAAAAAVMMKNMEKTQYNISSWGPRKDDPKQAFIMYSPEAAMDTSDTLTISGTPFDGKYPVKKGRTRREVWIQPGAPLTTTGSSGSFRVKTSVAARLRHLGSKATSEVRTGAKKSGDVVKKAAGKASSFLWDKIKKGLMILFALMILYLIVTTVIKAKVTQAVTPAPAPVVVA
jgi:hypothetical protein